MDRWHSILHRFADSFTHGIIALGIGFILFSVMERVFLFRAIQKPWRATLLDLQYAFLSMLYPPFLYFIISAFFTMQSLGMKEAAHDARLSPLRFAGEMLILLLVRDCLIYLRHRIFHLRPVWAFHSIHHSSEEVNWTSAARFHPGENLIEAAGEILLFIVCANTGFDSMVLATGSLFIGFYNFFIHSNLRWTFGPLRYVFVSPVFHRWHHSDRPEAADKNFAAMFSCLDLMFGTFYMPKDAVPDTTGLSTSEKPVHPRTMMGQLLYPFRKR